MADPLFEIYNLTYAKCLLVKPKNTFDTLPLKTENPLREIPFIYVGESIGVDEGTKTEQPGFVTQSVHVFCGLNQRKKLSEIMNQLTVLFKLPSETTNYRVSTRSITPQVIPNQQELPPTLHGVIEVLYYYS